VDPELKKIIDKANKKYGEGTILTGKEVEAQVIPRITTGSLGLDVALGGGWAANQWNEVIGDESHGKTALVMKTIAANQALDPNWTVLWFASESLNVGWAKTLGVDMDRVAIVDSNEMEFVFQTAIDALKARAVDCVVIDSLPALESQREAEKTMEDLQPGQTAFLTGKFFRMASPAIKRSLIDVEDRPCTGLIVNQWREKIGVMHGDPRTTPGGKAKNFYYYIRVECRRSEWIKNSRDKHIGQAIKVRNIKNKTAPPGSVGEIDFYFADGNGMKAGEIDTLKDVINVGIEFGVIQRGGGGYYMIGDQKWKGRESLVDALRADPDLASVVRTEVMYLLKTPLAFGADLEEESKPPKGWDPKKPWNAEQNVDHAVEQMMQQFEDDDVDEDGKDTQARIVGDAIEKQAAPKRRVKKKD